MDNVLSKRPKLREDLYEGKATKIKKLIPTENKIWSLFSCATINRCFTSNGLEAEAIHTYSLWNYVFPQVMELFHFFLHNFGTKKKGLK